MITYITCIPKFEHGLQAKEVIKNWIKFCNQVRSHSSFNGLTPAAFRAAECTIFINA